MSAGTITPPAQMKYWSWRLGPSTGSRQRPLRLGARGRTRPRLRAVEDAERGLVARAQQLVALGFVQADRTACMCAHFRVRQQAVGRPRLSSPRQLQQLGFDAEQHGLA